MMVASCKLSWICIEHSSPHGGKLYIDTLNILRIFSCQYDFCVQSIAHRTYVYVFSYSREQVNIRHWPYKPYYHLKHKLLMYKISSSNRQNQPAQLRHTHWKTLCITSMCWLCYPIGTFATRGRCLIIVW